MQLTDDEKAILGWRRNGDAVQMAMAILMDCEVKFG